ncbi:MAG: PhzA/PhzB family protein [Gammaproteobacteria bacterium]|nr:PhzA/PhzB family protein [Gammaproteobacteria bacterium]
MLDKRAGLWTAAAVLGLAMPGFSAESVPTLEPTAAGVRIGGDLVPGSTLIQGYTAHPRGAVAGRSEDHARNRATVQRFFQLPIGEERARLYADDGVKQLPGLGIQWPGLDAQLKNNAQNRDRYPGWAWSDVVIWNTDDPTVFWVEASGATAPGAQPAYANHYVLQFVVRGGRIALMREFGAPLRITPVPGRSSRP